MERSAPTETATAADVLIDPVTDEIRQTFQLTNFVIISGIISISGVVTNIMNIAVFVRQGFKDSINISLLGLAVSDFAACLTMFWATICYNPRFHSLDLPVAPLDLMYVTAGWPHVGASKVTSVITAFITLERCLCIAMPLKVKNIITPFRTKIILVSIFASVIGLVVPVFFVNRLNWRYNLQRNRTILCLTFTEEREVVESVMSVIHSVCLSTALFVCVVVCTVTLVVKLNKKTKWRRAAVSRADVASETTSVKENKVVKMIILISTIFIICNVPSTVIIIVMAFFPEFSLTGRFENMLFVVWSFLFILDGFNSSVNIVVYFTMSTKFRRTLCEMFFGSPHLNKSH